MDVRRIEIPTTELTGSDPFPTSTTDIRLSLENSREFPTADYRINRKSNTIDVTENLPVVAFKNYPTNITIGHSFTFTVEADPLPENPLPVGLNFFGVTTGLFASIVDSAGNTITDSVSVPTTGSVEITVTTAAAGTSGDQDSQFFGFSAGAGYRISNVLAENQPTINLLDNSSPTAARPNVALQTHSTDKVNLADTSQLTFNIIASDVPTNNVDVNVLISQTGGNFLSSSTVPPVRLDKTPSQTMTPFTVAIADDNTNSENGDSTITVTLTHGDGYTLVNSTADPNHTTSATVTDTPVQISTIGVTAKNNTVVEGSAVEFEFTAEPELAKSLDVMVTVSQLQSFLVANPDNITMVTIAANTSLTSKHLYSLMTNPPNGNVDTDGSVTLTISPDTTNNSYTVHDFNGSATVNIADFERQTSISVSAISTEVTENEMAQFEIRANKMSTALRTVNINIDDGTADFLTQTERNRSSIDIQANSQTFALDVPIASDSTFELHGKISVTIEEPDVGATFNYVIGSDSTASVVVYDDDAPTGISILAISTPVTEAADTFAEFQVISDSKNDSNARTINVQVVNDSGDDFIDPNQDAMPNHNFDSHDE